MKDLNNASTKNYFFNPLFYDALMSVERSPSYSAKGYCYNNVEQWIEKVILR